MMLLFLHQSHMPLHEWSITLAGVLFEPLKLSPHLGKKREVKEWKSKIPVYFTI